MSSSTTVFIAAVCSFVGSVNGAEVVNATSNSFISSWTLFASLILVACAAYAALAEVWNQKQVEDMVSNPKEISSKQVAYYQQAPTKGESETLELPKVPFSAKWSKAFSSVAVSVAPSSSSAKKEDSTEPILGVDKYKTELCRNFSLKGRCAYGKKCQFAHGEKEVRKPTRHPKYKTVPCKSFEADGHCEYKEKCMFIHRLEVASEAGKSHADHPDSYANTSAVAEKKPAEKKTNDPVVSLHRLALACKTNRTPKNFSSGRAVKTTTGTCF